jgi:ATP-binding cassette subfamily B protein
MKKVWRNNLYLVKLCFKIAPGYTSMFMFEKIRTPLMIFFGFTIGFNYVLECAEFGRPFWNAALVLIILIAAGVLGFIYCAFLWQSVEQKGRAKIQAGLKEKLYAKAKEIDLECYDNPDFYNDYVLAISESDRQIDRAFVLIDKVSSGVTSIASASGFLALNDPISFVFIAASFISMLLVGKLITKINFKIRNEKNPHERKLNYLTRVFYLNDYAKEIRLNTEVSEELLADYNQTCDEILAIEKQTVHKRFRLDFLKNYVCNDFLFDVLYIGCLVYQAAVLRTISYSSVVILFGTANRAKRNMNLIAEAYPNAQEISLYMDKIFRFLETEIKIVSPLTNIAPMPENPAVIELRDVSFKYGAAGDYVLKNINMKINPYSKIAIVGYNGAGKTTLIKLIMRLYDPNEGEILLDGVNIKQYDVLEYRKKIGAVFQDFKIFAATVKENVLLDNANKGSDEAVLAALEKSGFSEKLASLPGGINTNLTAEFEDDGVNLSGGEGQKIAISRVFYTDASLIVLDEPSSSLDPIAEYHLNHSMLAATENKSVLFISHRLSTTRDADKIFMLENGEIIEEGSHAQLLENKSKYSEMWRVQSLNYC